MPNRFEFPFHPIESTAPSFEVTIDDTSSAVSIESSGLREWGSPGSRVIRFSTRTADDYLISFGTTAAAPVASSSESILMLGGTVEVLNPIRPSITQIAFVSSTDVVINCTLGFGS